MHRKLESLLWAKRKTTLGAPGRGRFNGEEHPGISGFGVLPTMLLDELVFEGKQPLVSAGIGCP